MNDTVSQAVFCLGHFLAASDGEGEDAIRSSGGAIHGWRAVSAFKCLPIPNRLIASASAF